MEKKAWHREDEMLLVDARLHLILYSPKSGPTGKSPD